MDQHVYGDHPNSSSWCYDNPYHNNQGGGFSNYNQHHQTPFAGRQKNFSQSAPEHTDDCASHVKLYVRGVPREVTEQDIWLVFGKYGNIIEVVPLKAKKNLPQGSWFVKYARIEDADQAIRALDNQHNFPGGKFPIKVEYASGEQERLGKVFVSFLNKLASKPEIAEIFSEYGCVQDIFLLRDEQKQNVGTGFISFSHRDMAVAAINGLNGKYVMRGCDRPLHVRMAEPKKPKTGEFRPLPVTHDTVGPSPVLNTSHKLCNSGMADAAECDWSEHVCPDGFPYYYNCVTCESRWEKPEEYWYYEQQLEKCL